MEIKLLFITKDLSHYIFRNQHYLSSQLSKIVQLKLWHKSGHINDIISQIGERPDFILINDITHIPKIQGLSEIDIPKGMIAHDVHRLVKERKNYLRENKIDAIFSVPRKMFFKIYPEFADKFHWFPHFIDTRTFKDYKMSKKTNWLMMGKLDKRVYPLRTKMRRIMQNKRGFLYYKHPGYRYFSAKEKDAMVAKRYAKEINKAKIFLTCDSIYHYALLKYFEVLACNTLLLAPASDDLTKLGFIKGVHYVPVTEKDFLKKALYYIKNEKKRKKIAKQGYLFVRKWHSSTRRAKQLALMVQQILEKRSERGDAK